MLHVVFLVPSYRFEITLAFTAVLDFLSDVLELEPVIAKLVWCRWPVVDDVAVLLRSDSDCCEQLLLELRLAETAVGLIVLAWESPGDIDHTSMLDREFELAET